MPQEIERKFLVTDTSYRELATSSSHIVQGYICSDKGRTVRIRIRDDKGYLTIKGGSNAAGLSRYEWEQEIDVADAHDLLKLCEPGIIDKVRYLVPSGNHVFEVDEFAGENQGLVIAEVELAAENEPYTKPAFIGQEVTGNRRYYNSHLRVYPYSIWKNE
jgi:CYTH domain-containing protein